MKTRRRLGAHLFPLHRELYFALFGPILPGLACMSSFLCRIPSFLDISRRPVSLFLSRSSPLPLLFHPPRRQKTRKETMKHPLSPSTRKEHPHLLTSPTSPTVSSSKQPPNPSPSLPLLLLLQLHSKQPRPLSSSPLPSSSESLLRQFSSSLPPVLVLRLKKFR